MGKKVKKLFGGGTDSGLLAQQEALAKSQQQQIEEQRIALEEQELANQTAADRERAKRISSQSAVTARTKGRSSLIKTSELGTQGNLG